MQVQTKSVEATERGTCAEEILCTLHAMRDGIDAELRPVRTSADRSVVIPRLEDPAVAKAVRQAR